MNMLTKGWLRKKNIIVVVASFFGVFVYYLIPSSFVMRYEISMGPVSEFASSTVMASRGRELLKYTADETFKRFVNEAKSSQLIKETISLVSPGYIEYVDYYFDSLKVRVDPANKNSASIEVVLRDSNHAQHNNNIFKKHLQAFANILNVERRDFVSARLEKLLVEQGSYSLASQIRSEATRAQVANQLSLAKAGNITDRQIATLLTIPSDPDIPYYLEGSEILEARLKGDDKAYIKYANYDALYQLVADIEMLKVETTSTPFSADSVVTIISIPNHPTKNRYAEIFLFFYYSLLLVLVVYVRIDR